MPVNESNTIQYTVTTSRVPDGTTLYWKTTGNTTNSDIVGGNTGSIVINNNRAVFNVAIVADSNTDGTKTLGIALLTGSLSGTSVATTPTPIVVDDTSQTPTQFPVTVDYLMVAGGGGGGYHMYTSSGGGGAGGLLQGTTTINTATVYTVTIGAGGAGGVTTGGSSLSTYTGTRGENGANTIFSGADISTITTWGGGGGGTYSFPTGSPPVLAASFANGRAGGSAGGGTYGASPPFAAAFGSPGEFVGFPFPGPGSQGPQGYPSGSIGPSSAGAGGGGAGGRGQNPNPSPVTGGSGGNGYTWPITGVAYSGGGGGGSPNNASTGGPGGGGAGGAFGQKGVDGTANLGGGGGGGGPNSGNVQAASGGSGVVILAIPTPNYPGSAPGATVSTPPAAPGKTVLTFNSSGTLTL